MSLEVLSPLEFPRVNVESLKEGNVTTLKKNFTIVLVGETGTGKTSFLSLLVNVLAGKSPTKYNLEPYDITNEDGGGQQHSQTKTAKVYKFTSLNGVDVTVLDTPGVADTRGLQKDNEHKQSINAAIRDNIPEVTAVIILANGTNPRLGVATDYAITTLCSIFPRTLAQNIGIVFTNVSNPDCLNFEVDTLPVELRNAKDFSINNPFAMQKKYLKDLAKAEAEGKIDENRMKRSQNSVHKYHQSTVETLANIFDWLDGLQSQATMEITSLYDRSIGIEHTIRSTLARMAQLAEAVDVLRIILAKDSSGTKLTDSGTIHFKRIIQRGIWILQNSDTRNTTCGFPLCYTNCHEKCSGGFSLGRWKLTECSRFHRGTCTTCNHSITHHRYSEVVWYEEKRDHIDIEIKRRDDEANKTTTVTIAEVQKTIATYNKEIEQATEEIGRLAEEYSKLSLSGSFSGQVEKSVKLFETHLESIRNKSNPENVKQIEDSLNQLKKKLRLLQDAAKAARKKVYQPS